MPTVDRSSITPATGLITYGSIPSALVAATGTLTGSAATVTTGAAASVAIPGYLPPPTGLTLTGAVTGTGFSTIVTALAPTGVQPGTYPFATIVVDGAGRVQSAVAGTSAGSVTGNASIAAVGDGNITVSGSPAANGGTLHFALAPTGVSAGTYTLADVVVDDTGRIVAASSGSASGGGSILYGSGVPTLLAPTGTLYEEDSSGQLWQALSPVTGKPAVVRAVAAENDAGVPSFTLGSAASAGNVLLAMVSTTGGSFAAGSGWTVAASASGSLSTAAILCHTVGSAGATLATPLASGGSMGAGVVYEVSGLPAGGYGTGWTFDIAVATPDLSTTYPDGTVVSTPATTLGDTEFAIASAILSGGGPSSNDSTWTLLPISGTSTIFSGTHYAAIGASKLVSTGGSAGMEVYGTYSDQYNASNQVVGDYVHQDFAYLAVTFKVPYVWNANWSQLNTGIWGAGNTVVPGDALVVGANNHADTSTSDSLVLGDRNSMTGGYCNIISGWDNTITAAAETVLALGWNNNVTAALNPSLILGSNSTLGGNFDGIVYGGNNKANGSASLLFGSSNSVDTMVSSVFCFGAGNNFTNSVNMAYAFGNQNTLTGNYETFAFGDQHTVSGYCAMAYGYNGTLAGNYTVGVGQHFSAGGTSSSVHGDWTTDHNNVGAFVRSSANPTYMNGVNAKSHTLGGAQIEEYTLSGWGSSGSVRLTTDSKTATTNNIAALADQSAAMFEVRVVGRSAGSGAVLSWSADNGMIMRGTGAASVVLAGGSFVAGPVSAGAPTAGVPTLAADTTNGGFNISWATPAGDATDWLVVAWLRMVKVGTGTNT